MAKYISSVGLILDIVGVWLLAYEIVKPFKGRRDQLRVETLFDPAWGFAIKTAFDLWEEVKGTYGMWGLFLLTLGFILQLIGLWI